MGNVEFFKQFRDSGTKLRIFKTQDNRCYLDILAAFELLIISYQQASMFYAVGKRYLEIEESELQVLKDVFGELIEYIDFDPKDQNIKYYDVDNNNLYVGDYTKVILNNGLTSEDSDGYQK